MKAVLISIQPRHCENIASGKKTVEVRKTAPKIPTPFKCYIYETKKDDGTLIEFVHDGDELYGKKYRGKAFPVKGPPFGWYDGMLGKVIGEFVCDKIGQIRFDDDGDLLYEPCLAGSSPCLSLGKLQSYIGVNNVGYGWHISDLKIYDKPKDLSEFFKPCPFPSEDCDLICPHAIGEYHGDGISGDCEFVGCDNKITRPPQSWCYLEDEG